MQGRRPRKTGDVFAGIQYIENFLAEHDAAGRGSFAAVERSLSGMLLSRLDRANRGR
jgi:hypothetical protein